MDLGKLKTDPRLEENGAWCSLDHETEFLIISRSSRRFRAAGRRFLKKYEHVLDLGEAALPMEEVETVVNQAAANCLVGWRTTAAGQVRDAVEFHGEWLPYSPEAALRLCTELSTFRNWVEKMAANVENFRAAELARDSKNSSTASGGTSPSPATVGQPKKAS